MTDIETPLHPNARRFNGRLIGEVFVRVNMDLSQLNDSFRLFSERALIVQMRMMEFNKPLSLINLSGV
jgi:hypothetical protein